MDLDFEITERQEQFIAAAADEVLFGGAAGGGKSYGQFIDSVLYAAKHPRSKQIIFRRTFPELEQSIIRTFCGVLPKDFFKYNASRHTGRFKNGSIIDFGYMDKPRDMYRYQGAEYDVIRFDELTHFSEEMYIYMSSRLRGTLPFPRQIKSSTNPGGIGHSWVKKRFIDPAPPDKTFSTSEGTRIFIPSKVQDNIFLMQNDPAYLRRLERLGGRDRRALLYGDWDLFDGQYFDTFDRALHVTDPLFDLAHPPDDWEYYIAIDYGLDMLAALLAGVAPGNKYYIINEFYDGAQHPDGDHKGLIVSQAAEKIKELGRGFSIRRIFAPPDLWGRSKDTGKSIAQVFGDNGVALWQVDNNRISGWMTLKELLQPHKDERGATSADLKIFSNCRNLIRTLPALAVNERNPNDAATEPHELTHAPDALRYFIAGRPRAKAAKQSPPHYDFGFQRAPKNIDKGSKIKPI